MTTSRDRSVALPPWPALVELATKFIIYALIDLRFNTVRYIGLSSRGLDRPYEHAGLARNGHCAHDLRHCYNWIRLLQRLGLEYGVVVLEEVDAAKRLKARERWWIKFARAWGYDLTNLTDGGEGVLGYRHTQAMKAKMSATRRAEWASPAYVDKQRAALTAANVRIDVKMRRSIASRVTQARPDVKERQRAGLRMAMARPEYVNKQRTALCAAMVRPVTKAKQRAGATAAWARPEYVDKQRAGVIAALARPETKAKHRAGMIAVWARPKYVDKQRMIRARPEYMDKQRAGVVAANERVGRVQATTYRRLIEALPDATNAQIHAAVVAALGVNRAGPLKHAAWYRWQLRRRGLSA